jgi:para-nitrobenzyl esterase
VPDATEDSGSDVPDEGCVAPGVELAPGEVITQQGVVAGSQAREGVWSYLGLPFAQPPVGELRWAAPVAPSCHEGVLEARAFGPSCPQLADGEPVGEEDCLTLNVWRPEEAEGAPVMVFIHGGGNAQGSAAILVDGAPLYDGAAWAQRLGVVFVTVQYRLGSLGYLRLPELADAQGHAGNYGLLDLIAGLGWVQDNIAAFGGDPSRVMIFGESAGALNTCALLASPLAEGLFSRALMQSGACVLPAEAAVQAESQEVVADAGCEGQDVAACLRAKTPQELLLAHPPLVDVAGKSGALQPHPDGWALLDQPQNLLISGQHNHSALVVGANSDEASRTAPMIQTEEDYEALVRATFGPLADAVLEAYPVDDYATPRMAYVQLVSDVKFVCQARRVARAAVGSQDEPVYRYHFAHALQGNRQLGLLGAWHGLELLFLFQRLEVMGYAPTDDERALADAMMDYWGAFAWGRLDELQAPSPWPRYNAEADLHLVLDGEGIRTDEGVRTTQCNFWDSVLP